MNAWALAGLISSISPSAVVTSSVSTSTPTSEATIEEHARPSSRPPLSRARSRGLLRASLVTGGVTILLAHSVGLSSVLSMHCAARNTTPPDPYTGVGYESDWTECYPYGLFSGLAAATGGTIATAALASLTGYHWAEADLAEGRHVPPSRGRDRWRAGIGLRLLGATLFGGAVLMLPLDGCSDAGNGSPEERDTHAVRCFGGRVFGALSLGTVAVSLRWIGAGMMTYGGRIRWNRSPPRISTYLSPRLSSSSGSMTAGIVGHF